MHLQTHHYWHPRNQYKTKLEKRFRNLPCFLEKLNAADHKLRHQLEPNGTPGGKPRQEVMRRAIELHEKGACKCNQTPSS